MQTQWMRQADLVVSDSTEIRGIDKRVLADLQWFIRHFGSMDKSAAPNRNMGYPQVSGSIPVETPSMDLT